ncbi:MAG: helix-turn-helix transcriptional regulator [Brucellaceae bacterium]|nr:helix-turn-helix transcriptional regulator [Brucellaceae bacterium]
MQASELDAKAHLAADLLLAMANPKRLMILCHLFEGELSVTELGKIVDMNQSALSQQLAKLRTMRLVETRREAQTIFYRLASDEVVRVLETLHGIYCQADWAEPQQAEAS